MKHIMLVAGIAICWIGCFILGIGAFAAGDQIAGSVLFVLAMLFFWWFRCSLKEKGGSNTELNRRKDPSGTSQSSSNNLSNVDRKNMSLKQQFNNLIRNSRPWVKLSDYKTLKHFLDQGEVAWSFLILEAVTGAINASHSSDPYLLATNKSLSIYLRRAKGKSWDCLRSIPLENVVSWELDQKQGNKILKIMTPKHYEVKLRGIPEKLAVRFGNELTRQKEMKRKMLLEEEKEDLNKRINRDKIPEDLQGKVKDIEDKDRKELIQTKKALADYTQKEYVESFVAKYGSGTEGQLKKLQKLIAKRSGYEIEKEDLRDLVVRVWKNKAKHALKELLEQYKPNSVEDYIEAFVLEFGKGNEEGTALFAEIIDIDSDELKTRIKRKLSNLREQTELDRLKNELGLSREKEEEIKKKDKRSELSEEDKNFIQLLRSQGVSSEEKIRDLSGHEFEGLVANLFDKMGYESRVTSGSGDQGADVIASNSFETLAIQAKHYEGKVSNSAVQEASAAVNYYNADRAMVITTSSFTKSAETLADSNNVELHGEEWVKSKFERHLGDYEL